MLNIFQVLPKLQNLEVINYGDCLVRTEGAIAITEALKEGHQKLKVIVHVTQKFSSLKDNSACYSKAFKILAIPYFFVGVEFVRK